MFKSMTRASKENGVVLRIDDKPVLEARRIFDAKFFSEQCSLGHLVAVYEKNDKISVAFIMEGMGTPVELEQIHIELNPQPLDGTRVVLEVSQVTGLAFAHYTVRGDKVGIVTQTGPVGIFDRQEGERLLEHMRKEMWCFCVAK